MANGRYFGVNSVISLKLVVRLIRTVCNLNSLINCVSVVTGILGVKLRLCLAKLL